MREMAGIRHGDRGIALMLVLIVILVALVGGAIALRGSELGKKLSGNFNKKVTTDILARQALDMVRLRMHERMNPPPTRPGGGSWDWGDSTSQEGEDLRKFVRTDWDSRPSGQIWYSADGHRYHGYRFQSGGNIIGSSEDYYRDFASESVRQTGVFEPCTTTSATTCPKEAQWKVTVPGAPAPVALPTGPLSFDLRNDASPDLVYSLPLRAEAWDEGSDRRTIIETEVLLVASKPGFRSAFTIHANVLSRASLLSGYVKGTVGQYLPAADLPKDPSGIALDPAFFHFGQMGMLDWSCDDPGGATVPPCPGLISAGLALEDENDFFMTNMHLSGVVTNLDVSSIVSAHPGPYGTPPPWNGARGLLVDDGISTTGDPTNTVANDIMVQPDPLLLDPLGFMQGRDKYGGVTPATAASMGYMLNLGMPGNIVGVSNFSGPTPTNQCIFWTGGVIPNWTPATLGVSNLPGHPYSVDENVILAPTANCDVKITNRYVIDGDLIIAGDGTGKFITEGDAGPALIVTGNVYILSNVNLINGPPEVVTSGAGDLTLFRSPAWKASSFGGFAALTILAYGNIIIGNLANLNVYSSIMTYANEEIAYFNLDLTGDKKMDLLVPDGKRPNASSPRALNVDFQVKRSNCASLLSDFGGARAKHITCDSHGVGLLPKGSSLIDTVQSFAFMERAGPNQELAYGYVGTPDGSGGCLATGGRNPNPPFLQFVNDAVYCSEPPPGNLFGGPSWISEATFRSYARSSILAADRDSFAPNEISRVRSISAKLIAGQAIVGLASFRDKYTLPTSGSNPDSPRRPNPGYSNNTDTYRALDLLKDVNDVSRYPLRCGSVGNNGLEVFGGLYAPYINIISTDGLCVYPDNRPVTISHEPIYVLPGGGYAEDPS